LKIGSRTLLIYYLEERLAFNDRDVASMFMLMGLLGILIQGVLLKYINEFIGEKKVVVLSFVLGIVTNLIYGLAKHKSTIFIGIVVGTFSGMSFPTISAIKSNNVVRLDVS
jgi:fucose permease